MDDRQLVTLVALHAFLVSGRPTDNAIEAAINAGEQMEAALLKARQGADTGDDDDDDDRRME